MREKRLQKLCGQGQAWIQMEESDYLREATASTSVQALWEAQDGFGPVPGNINQLLQSYH